MDPAQLSGLFNLRGKVSLGLGPMEGLLAKLPSLKEHRQTIHFAGTNGKGSTLVTLESLLLASGESVCSFTSPHLVKFNERFRVDGKSVSDQKLQEALGEVCQALGVGVEDLAQTTSEQLGASFFEISFAMALLIGRHSDWMLVETGLGGRLDATNVLKAPRACVITSIGLDHTEYLGTDLASITKEKLGILKPGASVFLAPQAEEVGSLVRQHVRDMGLTLFESDPKELKGLSLGLSGEHQKENAATSVLIYRQMVPPEKQLGPIEVAHCLAEVSWPGRLERLEEDILLDGAHNQAGFGRLLAHLKTHYKGKRVLLAVGWMQGKDLFDEVQTEDLDLTFLPLVGEYYGASAHPETELSKLGPTLSPKRVALAYEEWKAGRYEGFDLLVIAGSLYLIGELKAYLQSN